MVHREGQAILEKRVQVFLIIFNYLFFVVFLIYLLLGLFKQLTDFNYFRSFKWGLDYYQARAN